MEIDFTLRCKICKARGITVVREADHTLYFCGSCGAHRIVKHMEPGFEWFEWVGSAQEPSPE